MRVAPREFLLAAGSALIAGETPLVVGCEKGISGISSVFIRAADATPPNGFTTRTGWISTCSSPGTRVIASDNPVGPEYSAATRGDECMRQGFKGSNLPILYWDEAMRRPGATQMQYVRALMESRPILSRVPDQSLIANELTGGDHIAATRGDGYAFVYSAQGRPFTVNMGKISGKQVRAWWFNPRSGSATELGMFDNAGTKEFACPTYGGFNTDYVLVLDDVEKKYPAPGTTRLTASTRVQ